MQAESEIDYKKVIGCKVRKRSNKPFKSRQKINTVRDICVNEQTKNLAFLFHEDDSNVECWRCVMV